MEVLFSWWLILFFPLTRLQVWLRLGWLMEGSVLLLQSWTVRQAQSLCIGKSLTQHYLLLIYKVYHCNFRVLSFFVKYVFSLDLEWICSTLVRQKGQKISFLLIIKGELLLTNPRLIWLCSSDLPGFTRTVYKRDHALITPESHVFSPLPEWYFWLAFESSGRKLCSCFLV